MLTSLWGISENGLGKCQVEFTSKPAPTAALTAAAQSFRRLLVVIP
jgi:hypothetical protein